MQPAPRTPKRLAVGFARQLLWAAVYTGVGGSVVAITVVVLVLNGRPDLRPWHEVELDEEFSVDWTQRTAVETFAEYRALEERLFRQLREEVYAEVPSDELRALDRYQVGSQADPGRWPRDWNRSFELTPEAPGAGVLLLHGLSDSPYSMRGLAERLHAAGAYALALRLPGHGTAPSGLVHAEWPDWAAAVRLGVRHVRDRAPGGPLVLVGYSNGGALSVLYALEALEDDALPLPDRLVLISPAIGITKLAALAAWQERLGHVLGLEKLAWNTLLPEYDPFKYNSFALNAGKQSHLVTAEIQARITRLAESKGEAQGALQRFPPTLAFQSVVDATVRAPVLVSGLFERLPRNGHELVVFDVDRNAEIEPVMASDPAGWIEATLRQGDHAFTITVLTNENERSERLHVLRRRPGTAGREVEATPDLRWPEEVFSLSHVALPFAPDDPVYGGPDARPSPGIALGSLAMRGERGVLRVSGNDMMRLRWNPFYEYVARRTEEVVLGGGEGGAR